MALTREEALNQLHTWTDNPSLLNHARAVEIAMHQAAVHYGDGSNPERWAITGLLHDADYQRWPDEHPQRIVDWLKQQNEEEIAYAIAVHQTKWNLPPKSMLDKSLLACDELTGFVIACCLVRPDGIASLEPKSVVKKLKDKAFAAKVDRQIIAQSIKILGVDLNDHLRWLIDALRLHAEELGIAGRP